MAHLQKSTHMHVLEEINVHPTLHHLQSN